MKSNKKFIFVVLTYNHSEYILEHLESIKFLILNYGTGYDFKLVIADDGSRDRTVELIKLWINGNSQLFVEIVIEGDGKNRGTCKSFTNTWKHVDSEYFKVTAGDDVYSFENLIAQADSLSQNDFVSGVPLLLIGGQIKKSAFLIFNIFATDVIYSRLPNFIDRLEGISVINTPSLFYNIKFLKNADVLNFINLCKVTEDFPMLVKIAEIYKCLSFNQTDKVFVYYRRTPGSTFLIRGTDFDSDKLKVFKHMLANEKSSLKKILLRNRIACYQSKNPITKKMRNLNYYIYLFRVLKNLPKILSKFFQFNSYEDRHKIHYSIIQTEALKYLNK